MHLPWFADPESNARFSVGVNGGVMDMCSTTAWVNQNLLIIVDSCVKQTDLYLLDSVGSGLLMIPLLKDMLFNTPRPRQDGRQFSDIFTCIFF